jgi:small subunit ribosomal protein S20
VPNTKTAKKQLRTSERNRVRNSHYKTHMKNALKHARAAIAAGEDAEAAKQTVNHAVRTLHRTATKGIIKRENASRRIGRLMHAYNTVFTSKPAAEAPAE